MRPGQDYTIGQLPRLIAQKFTRFNENLLTQEELSPEDRVKLYHECPPRDPLNEQDKSLITQFLRQWDHPVGRWLRAGETSASLLEQIRQIRNLASHLPSVYEWHFRLLLNLVAEERGLLRQVYGRDMPHRIFATPKVDNPHRILEVRRK